MFSRTTAQAEEAKALTTRETMLIRQSEIIEEEQLAADKVQNEL